MIWQQFMVLFIYSLTRTSDNPQIESPDYPTQKDACRSGNLVRHSLAGRPAGVFIYIA